MIPPEVEAQLAALETEAVNPRTSAMDTLAPLELVRLLHSENHLVAAAIDPVLPQIAAAAEVIAGRLANGGRLFYVGAGTSGRLGVLDASECPPTFSVSPELVQGIIAGGYSALTTAVEGAEDNPDLGASDLAARGVCAKDAVVGIAASGRTPYVLGALRYARSVGAAAVAVANVSHPAIGAEADIEIAAVTGPEPLTGSTRLKAGTAQKLILNLLSTAAMVRLGKTYGNLMVDVKPTNAKLQDRAVRIVARAAGITRTDAEAALQSCGMQVKPAIVTALLGCSPARAAALLEAHEGRISAAVAAAAK
jgi:N-acetylmuramic acid 6-phosphate etherase